MNVTFSSEHIATAMKVFYEQFSLETELQGFESWQRDTPSQSTYSFKDDTLIREIRNWGAGALRCGLLMSFGVSYREA